jgi:hypothetical protein
VASTTSIGTNALTTKPRSIWKSVAKMNHRLRWPFLSSPVDSAAPTEPAGLRTACQPGNEKETSPAFHLLFSADAQPDEETIGQ